MQHYINSALKLYWQKEIYFYLPEFEKMIDLLLLLFTIPGIVLLYYQYKEMVKQEKLIKYETESLRRLKEKNSRFKDFGLFGLQAKSAYLQIAAPKPSIHKLRRKVLKRQAEANKKLVQVQ